jgi:L-lactate dehydrogenase complex protein LldG
MSSRDDILSRLRQQTLPEQELPDLAGPWISYENLAEQFAKTLGGIGGFCHFVPSYEEARAHLQNLGSFQQAKQIASLIPELVTGNIDERACDDPHQLETIDYAILRGEFGVAENGAIWWWADVLRNRVLPFITQHLVLVIPANEIVPTMHQAYERIAFDRLPRFGAFIAGPSKTADIEQSLVIGAHGPRSLTVYCVG